MASLPEIVFRPWLSCVLCVLHFLMATPLLAQERIISLGGSVSEIVVALGAESELVAIDDSSQYPTHLLRQLPSVGYYRALSAEAVLAMRPTLVLADDGSGPPQTLRQLADAGVRVIRLPVATDVQTLAQSIRSIGTALERPDSAESLAQELLSSMSQLQNRLSALEAEPRVLFLLSAGAGQLMIAGRGSAADRLVRLSRGRNIGDRFDGYKPASPEALVELSPEIVITTQRTVQSLGSPRAVLALQGLKASPAARGSAIVVMDDLLALGFGPRLPEAVNTLASQLHPDWKTASDPSP